MDSEPRYFSDLTYPFPNMSPSARKLRKRPLRRHHPYCRVHERKFVSSVLNKNDNSLTKTMEQTTKVSFQSLPADCHLQFNQSSAKKHKKYTETNGSVISSKLTIPKVKCGKNINYEKYVSVPSKAYPEINNSCFKINTFPIRNTPLMYVNSKSETDFVGNGMKISPNSTVKCKHLNLLQKSMKIGLSIHEGDGFQLDKASSIFNCFLNEYYLNVSLNLQCPSKVNQTAFSLNEEFCDQHVADKKFMPLAVFDLISSYGECKESIFAQVFMLQSSLSNESFLHFVVRPNTSLMSIKSKLLTVKEPYIIAKLTKSACNKKTGFRGLLPQEFTYKEVAKMGGNNSRFITVNRVLPVTDEYNNSNPSVQKLMKTMPREVYRRSWRQEKRLGPYEPSIRSQLRNEKYRPKVPKRGTYIKHKAKTSDDKETSGESEKENKVVQLPSTVSNSDSSIKSLPSRSEVLPPDGDSFHSDGQKSPRYPGSVRSKCLSCSEIQSRLSKANTEKGVLSVCLEKAQNDSITSQQRVKELEIQLSQVKKADEQSCVNLKDLEAEMCQLQKDKAILTHELNVTRKQLMRFMDHYDASDSSHVSSVYVPGSEKNSDEDFRSISHDDQDEYFREVKEQLDLANAELERLKDVEIRNEELESAIRRCEDRIIELQGKLKKAGVEKRDASAQTIRKDGTFTRPPDKTKIPKRLLASNHSSLPVTPDPSNLHRFRSTTSSLTRVEMLQKHLVLKEREISNLRKNILSLEKEMEQKNITDWTKVPRLNDLKEENVKLREELQIAKENYHKEMVMRKKYFNMAEEMKGKIRVFCRIKPRDFMRENSTFLEVPDDYSVQITTQRATYEFTFDNVFTAEHSQEDVFKDVQNLVQSSLDGYNVCIFAYGQTGSGKTYTLVGTENEPGIGTRAFRRIFELVHQNQSELDFRIHASFFELYNDTLIDLLKNVNDDKLKIRRDHYGLVYVQGSESREVKTDKQLQNLFQEACRNRHVAATKMNTNSSRSHLVVTILIESTNKITGTVLRGKLSLVDLAGSERIGKTAAVAGQLKEANSINKSLSALGDVIAALSSEQQHVPYRNNKLTLLMQDSLGSNAKTLMFVTISSSELNAEESLNSLTYASRVKQITNAATRMAESKEIARLRSIIMKLSKEERINGRL